MKASQPLFKKILIANRGEIAVRVIRACRELGIATVAVYSEADAEAMHVRLADEAYAIGPAAASESYLHTDTLLSVIAACGADAVHPGYGFLSENADFARALKSRDVTLIGPSPEAMTLMGSKIASKQTMQAAGVPCVPGYQGEDQSLPTLAREALRIGFPLLVKASAGGGGKGMRIVRAADEFEAALAGAKREAQNAFGDESVLLERYFERVRHIEFQILADTQGKTVHVFERECSIQRRHQKVLEESPSVALSPSLRQEMGAAAVAAAKAVNYTNAGTVEMLLDDQHRFYFLEMNTRLQVEHPVTEMVSGLDLVKEQIRIAAGLPLAFEQTDLSPRGHAIEVRVYAEDPDKGFLPTTGTIRYLKEPQGYGIRVDSALYPGYAVTPFYDPMLAKLIVHGHDRTEALARLRRALSEYVILGLKTNLAYLGRLAAHPALAAGETWTHFISSHEDDLKPPASPPPEVLAALLRTQAAPKTSSTQAAEDDPYNPWRLGASLNL
ncbi:MAG: 3-methylcrotonyl-CoA carboxylase [Candidatus Melainabacteria bacterium HGW-Melainabacteria-1]|nr:MAG: 3-methylcrotonyl-CoA carboxylase [Candidatus Melainabacteria bacterium HGW-Melainabacteria-1]